MTIFQQNPVSSGSGGFFPNLGDGSTRHAMIQSERLREKHQAKREVVLTYNSSLVTITQRMFLAMPNRANIFRSDRAEHQDSLNRGSANSNFMIGFDFSNRYQIEPAPIETIAIAARAAILNGMFSPVYSPLTAD
jgi:hypothetical protein